MKAVVTWVVLLLCGYSLGVISFKYRLPPIPLMQEGKEWVWTQMGWENIDWMSGFNDVQRKKKVDCAILLEEGTKIFLAFGQSNSANMGLGLIDPGPGVFNFNFFDGHCYEGKDPLLGAAGNKASVWTRLGKKLVEQGLVTQVMIVPLGVNGASIKSWMPGQNNFIRIEVALKKLRKVGLSLTHILWHQGEADAHVLTKEEYQESFWEMEQGIRALGVEEPLFVSIASICHDRGSEEIRQAQQELAFTRANIFPGPKTDDIVYVWERRDSCHFSEEGLEKHANMWVDALLSSGTL